MRKSCSICSSPPEIRQAIDMELSRRTHYIDIAAMSGHSKSAIGRHAQRCLSRRALREHRDRSKSGPRRWVLCSTPEEEAALPPDCGVLRLVVEPLPQKLPNPRALRTAGAEAEETKPPDVAT